MGLSSAPAVTLLVAATLLCLLPFSNKAFNVDDPLFLWSAQQISQHPLDPYGFNLIWMRSLRSMPEITKNPPLACYYAAAVGVLAGWSERAMHLGFLVPALAMVLGTYRLASRFTQSPLIATAATLLTPGVLVSATSVMCDTMMLALWIWAAEFWLKGLDTGARRYLAAASVLMGAAALTKYFGICLVPLLFVYSLTRERRLANWAWYFVVPVSLLTAFQLWSHARYGHGMFSDALGFAPQRLGDSLYLTLMAPLVAASFIGGCALSALALAPLIWSRRQILIGVLALAVGIAVGWIMWASHLDALRQEWRTVGLQLVVYVGTGLSVLMLAVADVWTERSADSLFLALWVYGTFVFTTFLNWTINGRSVLPLIPAVGILLARRLDKRGTMSIKGLRIKVACALAACGIFSIWVEWADVNWANSTKQMATTLRQHTMGEMGKIWFQGHWGFQYYMQLSNMSPLDFNKTVLNPGDLVVIPENNYATVDLPREFVAAEEVLEIQLHQAVTTMCPSRKAGFYGTSSYGSLPFGLGVAPPERYRVFRIKSTMEPNRWSKH